MELEANAVATRVASGASPAEPVLQRAAEEEVQRREGAGSAMSGSIPPHTASTIAHPGSGAPMPGSVRHSIERHLGTDLGGVRVHTGPNAARAATSLGARAFTVGNDIFLNRQESPLDTGLMAHESAHVVQQGAASANGPVAARATEEIQLLPDFITDKLADYARHVPGYTLLTYIIEYDPLRGEPVKPTAMALVEGLMGLVPFGTFVFDQLSELGVLERAFEFIQGQLAMFDLSLERLERTISEAWEEMDFKRFDPFDYNLGVLERHLGRLVNDVTGFASSVISAVMNLIKEALIGVAEGLLAENKAWALIKKILHYDPLRGEEVDASTVEILEDFLLLIGREQELEQMRMRGTLQQTADWLDTQVKTFLGLLSQLATLFSAAWEAIQPANLPDLPTTLPTLVQQAGAFLQQVWDFASTVASQVIELIKEALLGWLASFVDEVPGFHLLTVILGRNPFTGEAVPRSAVNLIRGFITLIPGGNEIYDRLAETGIIADAGARIEGAITELGISWEFIVGLFIGIWDTVVSIDTLIDPIGVFTLIRDQFGEPVSRLFAFIRVVLRTMFELLLALMNFPTDLIGRIIDNAMQAYEHIKRDPIGFLINMLAAVKLGFSHFFDNFLSHLVSGLVDWLFRGLRAAGIEPPEDLSFGSILQTVLQVLGISVERIWEKLAERFGQETIDKIRAGIDKVVGIWQLVQDISERGIGALWEYVESQLSNLWDTVLQAATDWIMEQVVNRVVTKLLSMLDPTGIMAVINGFVAFFNAIQSAIEYLRDILEIVDSYVATIASVAAGDIEPGAARLEGGLASAIPVAIGFLAKQVGLGDIGPKIAEIVGHVREVVDKALDWLLDKLQAMVNRVLAMLGLGAEEVATGDEPLTGNLVEKTFTMDGQSHTLTIKFQGKRPELMMASATPRDIRNAARAGLVEARAKKMDAAIVDELEMIIKQTEGFDTWLYEHYDALVLPARDDHEQTVAQARTFFDVILHQAIEFGRKHHLKDLMALGHPSKYVLNDEVRKEYRSAWRETFYQRGWSSTIDTWKDNEMKRLRGEAATRFPNHLYVVDPGKQAFLVEDRNRQYPPSPEVDYVRPGNVQIDHVRSVSDHFQTDGNNQIQKDRDDWYELQSNLQILNWRWNREKSGRPVTNWNVTLNFRGPGE